MKRAGKTVGAFRKQITAGAMRIAKYGAALAAVAIGGLVLIVRHQLKAIDVVAKLSAALGIQVDKLQAIQLAASIAGIEIDKVGKAMNRMVKSVNDGTLGLTTAVRAFDALGLDVNELANLNPDEIFKRIADAVQDAGNGVKTLGAIMDIFGARNGLALINLLKQGSEGINRFEREIDALGLAMSRVDVAQVEAANDSMTRARALIGALAQKLVVELSPFITATFEKFIQLGTEGTKAGEFIAIAMEKAAKAVAAVAGFVQSLVVAWKGLQVAAAATVDFFAGLLGSTPGEQMLEGAPTLFGDLDLAAGAALALEQAIDELDRALDNLDGDPWGDIVLKAFEDIRRAAREAAEDVKNAGDEFNKLGDVITDAAGELMRMQSEADRIKERLLTPLERFNRDMKRLQEIFDAKLISDDQFELEKKRLKELLDKAREAASEFSKLSFEPKRTGEFSQVNSIARLALKGVVNPAQNRIDEFIKDSLKEIKPAVDDIRFMLRKGMPINWV